MYYFSEIPIELGALGLPTLILATLNWGAQSYRAEDRPAAEDGDSELPTRYFLPFLAARRVWLGPEVPEGPTCVRVALNDLSVFPPGPGCPWG